MNFFERVKQKVSNTQPMTLLTYLEENHIESYNEYFNFDFKRISPEFYSALSFLESNLTISKQWCAEKQEFSIIGQTIDGDYVAADLTKVYVIPVSLMKQDIETYELSAIDFFVAYEKGKINSKILAKN